MMSEPSVAGSLVLLVWFSRLKSLYICMAWRRVSPPLSLLTCKKVFDSPRNVSLTDHLPCPPDTWGPSTSAAVSPRCGQGSSSSEGCRAHHPPTA